MPVEKNLQERVNDLEREIKFLKAQLQPTTKKEKFFLKMHKSFLFVLSYWVFLTFLTGLITAAYIKYEFGLDYFEPYRHTATTKKIAEVYRQIGDRMMLYNEWKAAEEAYQNAIKIHPANIKATAGILKAQVFQPLPGQKTYAPEVVDAKLASLLSLFPDDYEVYCLKGVRYLHQGDFEQAKTWFEKAIGKNPQFMGGYLGLGFIHAHGSDLEESSKYYKKALELDPDYALAHNNLAVYYIRSQKFTEAIEHCRKANASYPTVGTAYNLGDAYLYSGSFEKAGEYYEGALNRISNPKFEMEREGYASGEYIVNYMPLKPGDHETIKRYVTIATLDHKKALFHYMLSFTYALKKNFDAADREFKKGLQLERHRDYEDFFVNKILSIENHLNLKGEIKGWFEKRKRKLQD